MTTFTGRKTNEIAAPLGWKLPTVPTHVKVRAHDGAMASPDPILRPLSLTTSTNSPCGAKANTMKRILMAALVLTLLALAGNPADAKYPPEGPGIGGTVTMVARQYFMMDLDGGGYLKIAVSANTHFQLHGQKSDPSHVKKGVRVRITDTTDNGSIVDAYKVNVVREAGETEN